MSTARRVQVFGPAYLDRVVRVDRALAPNGSQPLDQSVDGVWTFGPSLTIREPGGATLTVEPPPNWPGPNGLISLSSTIGVEDLTVRATDWHDCLGGMGSGFAAALGGRLIHALGAEDDPLSQAISALLESAGIASLPLRNPNSPADWTLMLTSGPHGDKLPIGFRGCHAGIGSLNEAIDAAGDCDLRVVAALPNRLAAQGLRAKGADLKVLAPSTRNMTDREVPLAGFAEWIDLLCCNRREWECLDDREQVAWRVSVLAITDGPDGSVIRYTSPDGEAGRLEMPAFPRSHPPTDTNRAGESFAVNLIKGLTGAGWKGGVVDASVIRQAAERASAAAALVLDMAGFEFPTDAAIDAAIRAGGVGRVPGYNAGESAK